VTITCPHCGKIHKLQLAAAVMYSNGAQQPVWVAVCPVTSELIYLEREAK